MVLMQQGSLIRLDVAGMRLIQDANCLECTEERLFPESRHRSARIRKKLIKRHGGEFRMQPTAYQLGDRIVVHPEIARQLTHELNARRDQSTYSAIMGNPW